MSDMKRKLLAMSLAMPDGKGNKNACFIAMQLSLENGAVYLDNAYAEVSSRITRHQWAGYLAALEKEGKYRPSYGEYQGVWGYLT